MHKVIERIVDKGEFSKSNRLRQDMITLFARLDGRTVGSWPITPSISRSHRHQRGRQRSPVYPLLRLLQHPLIFLVDTRLPAGIEQERRSSGTGEGFARLSEATGRIHGLHRKAYGEETRPCAASARSDLLLGWPSTEMGLMNPPRPPHHTNESPPTNPAEVRARQARRVQNDLRPFPYHAAQMRGSRRSSTPGHPPPPIQALKPLDPRRRPPLEEAREYSPVTSWRQIWQQN